MTNADQRLNAICTVAELAKRIHYHPRTIRRWCEEGRIAARQASVNNHVIWLIDLRSAYDFVHRTGRFSSKSSI